MSLGSNGGAGRISRAAGALAGLGLLAGSLAPEAARAHPHGWIDVRVELQFDAAGAVVSLRQSWLFDPYYTAFATEGLDGDGDGRPDAAALAELLEVNLTNLADYGYFTEAALGGRPLAFGAPEAAASALRSDRLEMSFLLPLAEPADPGEGGLVYRVYDPTYYIEMLHAEEPPAVRLVEAPAGCDYRIAPAAPNPEVVALAAAADRSQRSVPGFESGNLGALFAETVTVTCP